MSTDTATEPTANIMSHEECVCGSEKYCPRATARLHETAQSSTTSEPVDNEESQQQQQQQLAGKNSCRFARQLTASAEPLTNHEMNTNKGQRLVQQRSILKNSVDRQQEENEILEAKKQLILRRRRMFSHYRQYGQWRRRQFSYDPCYLVNTTPKSHSGYGSYGLDVSGVGVGVGGGFGGNRAAAGRRRRQYRRQFSYAEECENLLNNNNNNNEQNERHEELNANSTHNNNNMKICQSPTTNLHSEPVSHIHILEKERSVSISERCTRSRINSAIFVSSDGNGFDSIEFLRRHGSQSVLCRKARSAENITDNARKKSFSHHNKELWGVEQCNVNNNNNNNNNISFDNAKNNNNSEGNVIELPIEQLAHVTTALASSVLKGNLAPVTTSSTNIIVGSVSIEAPPAHIQNEEAQNSSANETTDAKEDNHVVSSCATKPRMLVHQTLSNASNYRSQSFSSTSSAHNSPKTQLNLKIVKPKIDGLPLVSVSGPSPPLEKPPSECL